MQKNSSKNNSKIIGIQFSIISPDEIRKGSVAEIVSRDTYINNKPVIGGLFDPRMGVLESGLICPTDGLDYMSTPGYFGHIELARPVFYIQYLSTILKCLNCVCFKCSKILISKKNHEHALKLNAESRWKYVYSYANSVKRCGESTDDGCGYLQPTKIRKEGFATIFAEWDNNNTNIDTTDENKNIIINVTAEMVLKIFKRISDEDVTFMGFSPIWSRPDWMICQVMSVSPPAVRPSVKHDAQQRSEDDLTHILVNIIKTNKTLKEKIQNNAPANVISDWTTLLQYHIAVQVDNKIPGVASVTQRSGRPFKSIKERLNGKGGRMRGNLMAKRVDFSARSVITADPNISIRELGIPMKIAMNITKPVIVNKLNKMFLTKLVQNGPDVWPGAKILDKKNGESITLRYIDRKSIILEEGEIVHRHMMDGDAILFNRQPTLHRMSMMCHIAKIMAKGDTFRMNVADTKPYNADFDGDEMNLHMPQDPESEAELRYLAAVPYQIISPANNSSIIGIYQDSMLGCYQFTRENITFTPREAMNLLMMFNEVNEKAFLEILEKQHKITNYNILSQICPPLSLKYKTKGFNEEKDDVKTTKTGFIEILNGEYIRGQMTKDVLAAGSKGLLQRICNDFGNMASAKFIDDLQNIITEYMNMSGFSVGISDLISDKKTNNDIVDIITKKKKDVKNLIDQLLIGVFENNTGKTNEEEFETQVNNILSQATSESSKIALKSLNKANRFVTMVKAGSKGSDLNISFMISCVGQQNVDGKRIPYGFDNRTLPHYSKFDDSPGARGFVESSYINGLTPQELFFHAMGGRVGLIDTAVKTSTTGYIQRRLIKGLEDLMVNYDMTVRTNKNKIVQFSYGYDSIDSTKVETQQIPIVTMSIQDIYAHYNIIDDNNKNKILSNIFLKNTFTRYKKQIPDMLIYCKKYTDMMIESRKEIIQYIFNNKGDSAVSAPVAFLHIINNIQGQTNLTSTSVVDITIVEAFELIEETYKNIEKIHYAPPTELFKTLYYYYLSPKDIILVKRFNKNALMLLLSKIILDYKRAIVAPGEMVGMISGQSIGEVSTQMSVPYSTQHKIVSINKFTGKVAMNSIIVGEFCDKIIQTYPDMTFKTGYENSVETMLDNCDEDYYIFGVSENETTSWNKISHISRHPVNGEIMKITTKSGRVVETTLSHSHLIRCGQTHRVIPITGKQVRTGMRIPVAKNIDNHFVMNEVIIEQQKYDLDNIIGSIIGSYLVETNIEITQQLSHVLLSKCFDEKTHIKKIPDFAFIANEDFKSGLLNGYFENDKNLNFDNTNMQITTYVDNLQLLKDIALMLNYFGIFVSIHHDTNKLIIHSNYIKDFMKYIGSKSILHKEKLDILMERVSQNETNWSNDEIDKVNGLREIITHCCKTLNMLDNNTECEHLETDESVSRINLEKYYNIFQKNKNSYLIRNELTIIEQSLVAGVVWDEIIKIEIYTPCQNNFVYDFTVPGNQTFMTDYGVIVHNTLNTFHFAGVASKSNVTRGVPRIEEILSLSSEPKNPSLTIYLKEEDQVLKEKANTIMYMIEHTILSDIVKMTEICFDPDDLNTLIQEDKDTIKQYYEFENMLQECNSSNIYNNERENSKWIIRMEMDSEIMLEKNITMDDVSFAIKNSDYYSNKVSCIYSDYNSDKLIFRIRMQGLVDDAKSKKQAKPFFKNPYPLDQSDDIYMLKNFQENLLQNIILRGIKGINKVILRKIKDNVIEQNGIYKKQDIWVLDTIGTNLLDVLGIDYIDSSRTFSNNIVEIFKVLGIEAARQSIYNELADVIEFDGTYINYHNFSILIDRMTFTHKMISMCRHGINNDNIGPIAKASFEETPEMFLKAARHAEFDTLRGVSANVMCGQEGFYGTSAFQVFLDIEEMIKLEASFDSKNIDASEEIDEALSKGMFEKPNDACSINNIAIQNNVVNIKSQFEGDVNDYDPGF